MLKAAAALVFFSAECGGVIFQNENSVQARDVDVLHPTSGLSHQQNSGESEAAHTYRSRLSACYGIEEAILRIDGSIGLDTSHSSAEMYEPQRFFDTKFTLPPKRFYRTFWRSAAMRLIQQQRLKLT